MTQVMRAARYFAMTRVSSKRQAAEGLSLSEQTAKLKADREAHFGDHTYVPVELSGVSGGKQSDRHREALLAEIRDGDVLAAVALDRFGRSTRSVLNLILGAADRGATVRALRENINTDSPVGRALIVFLAAIAELEREFNSERVKNTVARRKREEPVWAGGRRPYCFRDSTRRELVASEVRVWNEEIVPRFLMGLTEGKLCRELNRMGIRSAAGGDWWPSSLTKQLQRPYMYGLRLLDDGSLVETDLPAPSDSETYTRVMAIFEARAPMPERRGRDSLVAAIATPKQIPAVCGHCGSIMRISSRRRADGTPVGSYTCDRNVRVGPGTCPQPTVPVGAVTSTLLSLFADDLMDERETRRLMALASEQVSADTRRALRESERSELTLRSFRDRLRGQFRAGELSGSRFEQEMDQADADLAAVEAETERLRARVEEFEGDGDLYRAEQQLLDRLAEIRVLARETNPQDREGVSAVAAAMAQVIERVELVDVRLPVDLTVPLANGVVLEEGDEATLPLRLISTGVEGVFLHLVPRHETGWSAGQVLEPGRVPLPTIAASSR